MITPDFIIFCIWFTITIMIIGFIIHIIECKLRILKYKNEIGNYFLLGQSIVHIINYHTKSDHFICTYLNNDLKNDGYRTCLDEYWFHRLKFKDSQKVDEQTIAEIKLEYQMTRHLTHERL